MTLSDDDFNKEIKDEEIREFVTVGDVAEYLEKVTAAAPDRKKNGK